MCIDQNSIIISHGLLVRKIPNGIQNSNYFLIVNICQYQWNKLFWHFSEVSPDPSKAICTNVWSVNDLWVNNTGLKQLEIQHWLTESHSWVVMLKECRPHMRYSAAIQSSLCNRQHQTKAYLKTSTWQTPIQKFKEICEVMSAAYVCG